VRERGIYKLSLKKRECEQQKEDGEFKIFLKKWRGRGTVRKRERRSEREGDPKQII
jgi:hypothetical protein